MTPNRAKVVATLISLVLAALPLWSAAEPNAYIALTAFSGQGKHPSSSQTALIIDKDSAGTHFVCFGYTILTDRKIKGRVSVDAELLSTGETRVLQSFNNVAVESLELSPPENPCTGEQAPVTFDFNYGQVSECISLQASLKSGDVVRWVFEFEKMSRLKGTVATFQVLGEIIPNAFGVTAEEATGVLLGEWADPGMLPSR